MKLLLIITVLSSLSLFTHASELVASVITKKENQLVMISDVVQSWELNQVPFNSIKNLRIKGTFLAHETAILVFDLKDAVSVEEAVPVDEANVMTSQKRIVPVEIVESLNAIRIQILPDGQVSTLLTSPEKAIVLGKIDRAISLPNSSLYLTAKGQIITENGQELARLIDESGQSVALLTDLDSRLAKVTGSGSEIVIAGEKKEFISSISELENLNQEQKENPNWSPVTDIKISNMGSVVQIEFRNSGEDESFSLFKMISPLVVNQVRENQGQN